MSRAEIRTWEKRWAPPVAVAAIIGVAVLLASRIVNDITGDTQAEALRSTATHHGTVLLTAVLQGVGILLFLPALYYLFRACAARSPQVRRQLVGLLIAAPIFLAVAAGLSIGAQDESADTFVNGEAKQSLSRADAKEKCEEDREGESAQDFADEYEPAKGESAFAACQAQKLEDEEASNAISEASLTAPVSGLTIAGGLGFLATLAYTGLWAMRTGLMSRFWGSLGMASGLAFLLGTLYVITLVWFLYLALLIIDRVPKGRPPAWDAAEAIPWETAGQRVADELRGDDGTVVTPDDSIDATARDGSATEGEPPSPGAEDPSSKPPTQSPPPRKRKRRQ